MKKCRKIRAQAYVHRRIRVEGACLRSDRKIPTRTKSTRIVGSLSSTEFTGCLWPGVLRLRVAGRPNNRTSVPRVAAVPFWECWCFETQVLLFQWYAEVEGNLAALR